MSLDLSLSSLTLTEFEKITADFYEINKKVDDFCTAYTTYDKKFD